MLGLPSETEDDLMGIVELSTKVAAAGHFRKEVTASVSNFVPKPHTPFQWAAQLPIAEMEARQRFLRSELGKRRIKFRWHDARLSYLEGIISRGDRRIGLLLRRAFELGCRFDGWNEQCRLDLWEQALTDTGLAGELCLRRRRLDEVLPWDHLSSGVTKAFLQRELALAFERTLTPDCSVERCTYCGACDFTTIRNVDYHVAGAKGSEHRGDVVDHWASEIVSDSDAPGAWEPRGWHKIRDKVDAAAAPMPAAAADGARPLAGRGGASVDRDAKGLGNAEEWLAAGGEALTPVVDLPRTPQTRIRLTYTKLGRARFISTLELTTLFSRAARRADLPIAFSQGHHPLPRFAFSPGLAVGVESRCELVDLDLVEPLSAGTVRERMAPQLPEGMVITAAETLPLHGPSISASIAALRYEIDVAALINGDRGAAIRSAIAAFNGAAQFPLVKHAKGVERTIDARPFVAALRLTAASVVDTTLLFGSRGTVKPTDLLAAVLGIDAARVRALPVCKVDTIFHPVATAAVDATVHEAV